jgi:hypothetical protein
MSRQRCMGNRTRRRGMQREWRVKGLRDSFGQVPYAQDAVDGPCASILWGADNESGPGRWPRDRVAKDWNQELQHESEKRIIPDDEAADQVSSFERVYKDAPMGRDRAANARGREWQRLREAKQRKNGALFAHQEGIERAQSGTALTGRTRGSSSRPQRQGRKGKELGSGVASADVLTKSADALSPRHAFSLLSLRGSKCSLAWSPAAASADRPIYPLGLPGDHSDCVTVSRRDVLHWIMCFSSNASSSRAATLFAARDAHCLVCWELWVCIEIVHDAFTEHGSPPKLARLTLVTHACLCSIACKLSLSVRALACCAASRADSSHSGCQVHLSPH